MAQTEHLDTVGDPASGTRPLGQPEGGADEKAEVLIVGGGMAGMMLACALGTAGIRTVVVDRQAPPDMLLPGFDGRTTAIAAGSARIMQGIGVWPGVAADAEPILDIRVADGHPSRGVSRLFLHYDHRAVGDEPLGYIVENRIIRRALFAHAEALPAVSLRMPVAVAALHRDAMGVQAELADGSRIRAGLAVAADGRNSRLREAAGIGVSSFRYRQVSIVCTVAHECHHAGTAVELFLPGGPFAMLPMTGNRTNIVWSERSDMAQRFLRLNDADFLAEVQRRFGDWLGALSLEGPRFSYPLGWMLADRYTAPRLALISEAAHVIHPLAGQGLNMGIRDVAALAEAVVDARRLGLDPGAATALAQYERWRRFDNMMLATVTDGLTRIFSNDIPPLRLGRDLGLAAVNRVPPLKQFFMRHAMGLVGDLPRLARGEAL